MPVRCAHCGNESRFEVRRTGVLRFAAYPDPRQPGALREEKLPLGWEVEDDRQYVCRACGSTEVTSG
jgi:hypothetical protein